MHAYINTTNNIYYLLLNKIIKYYVLGNQILKDYLLLNRTLFHTGNIDFNSAIKSFRYDRLQ